MLSFNFFDSNEWEVVSNEAMKDKIKALEKEIFMNDRVGDEMRNKIATLKADNDALRSLNENMKGVIKNNSDYISELENKVKHLEAANEKLLIQDRIRNGVISLSSDLNTKINNQSKEITHLLKAQEKLKTEIVNKEQIISSLDANCNMLKKRIGELNEGIRDSDDITWKNRYESLKKCVNIQCGVGNRTIDGYISELENKVKKLEEENIKAEETLSKIADLIRKKGVIIYD